MTHVLLLALLYVEPAKNIPIFYTATPEYRPNAWIEGKDRFPKGAQIRLSDGRAVMGVAASADPYLSPDATKLLFIGKRQLDDPWSIWESDLRTLTAKLVRPCPEICMKPFDLGNDSVVFASRAGGRFQVEVYLRSSGSSTPITFSPDPIAPVGVLQDGRILLDSVRVPNQRFPLAIFPDGTGVSALPLDLDAGADYHDGSETPFGRIMFLSGTCATFLAPRNRKICGVGSPLREIGDGSIIFDQQDPAVGPRYRLNRILPSGTVRMILSDPQLSLVQPNVIRPKAVPRAFPSGLTATLRQAHILVLPDPRQTDSAAPRNRLRVLSIDQAGNTITLGEASFQPDGSSFVEIPGDRPIRFELITPEGAVARRQNHWIWFRTGERRRCVGCHVPDRFVPLNRRPAALVGGPRPVHLDR